ncbi:hypothetical protein H8957_011781 [Semnopithecus entellus]
MTERPPTEAAHSDPQLEGRDAAEARMAPPHLVLLNGVAKETSRAAPAEPPVIELGARGGPGGGPAGGGGAARDLKGRDAPATEARHRVPTTELCRPPGPAPAPAPASAPAGDHPHRDFPSTQRRRPVLLPRGLSGWSAGRGGHFKPRGSRALSWSPQ